MSLVLQTPIGHSMDDNEASCCSISSVSSGGVSGGVVKYEWKLLKANLSGKEMDLYLNELPKNITRGSRQIICSLCDKSDSSDNQLHKMKVQTRICKDKACKEKETPDCPCPAKYKLDKCEIGDKAQIWQTLEHLDENNNRPLRDAINNKTPTKTESVSLGTEITNTGKAKKTRVSIAKKEAKTGGAKRTPNKAADKTLTEKPILEDKTEPKSATRRSFADFFGMKLNPVIDETKAADSDSAAEIIESPIVQAALNTSVSKETPKKTVQTPVKNVEINPKEIMPKKSAFDFLMSKKKVQLNESFSKGADSDSECIVLDTSRASVCDSPKPKSPSTFFTGETKPRNSSAFNKEHPEKRVWMNFVDDPIFQTHQHQFTAEDEEFLNKKSTRSIPFKHNSSVDFFDVNSIQLNVSLKFDLNCTLSRKICDCHKNFNDVEIHNNELDAKLSQNSEETLDSPSIERETKRRKTEKNQSEGLDTKVKRPEETELWTEKYQFKSENDIVTNNSQLERLKEWLRIWKTRLAKQEPERPTKKANKKKKYEESESEYYDSDFSNADSSKGSNRKFYTNALLLSGPHGCGKTSSVYAIAKLLGYKVFEVNASSSRHKNQIIQELDGALNSHHVANVTCVDRSTPRVQVQNNLPNTLGKNKDLNGANTADAAKFKLEKFFNSACNNLENKESSVIGNVKLEKKPKKRKNSLRRETIHNLTNKINLNFSRRKNEEDEDEDEEDEEDSAKHGSQDSDVDADDFFNKETNKNHKVKKVGEKKASCPATPEAANRSVNIQRESLILFDEIDVIFKEDVGFWSAIMHFIKRSRKPILLSTTDEYLQDKMNLNVEKIDFMQPRIDASVRFLKRVAKKEHAELDTPTAYQILNDTKCDLRRALIQLQMHVASNPTRRIELSDTNSGVSSTLTLANYLPSTLDCIHKTYQSHTLNGIFFLDQLSKRISPNKLLSHMSAEKYKTYDLIVFKDGLSDNADGAVGFNPFMPAQPAAAAQQNEPLCHEDLVSTELNDCQEIYRLFMGTLNAQRLIRFEDWVKHGAINSFSFASNSVINKFAQFNGKLTSNQALSLDYRPYLLNICRLEEIKQTASTKRRYLHYLTYYNIGLAKEDYSLLARSNLAPKMEIVQTADSRNKRKSYKEEDDLYSDGGC